MEELSPSFDTVDGKAQLETIVITERSDVKSTVRNIWCSMIVICSMVTMQGMIVSGFLSSVLYQIEKQFSYSSTQSGMIHSCYDFFFGITAFLVSFLGASRKMLFISIGALVMALGSFSFIIPNFIPSFNAGPTKNSDFCNASTSVVATLAPEISRKFSPLIIFCISYAIIGIGASPLHTLGPAHLSEDIPPETSGWYLSIMYFLSALGPAFGFFLNSPFLDIPNNLKYDRDISVGSETWIGAWWIGYIICAFVLLFIFIFSLLKYRKTYKRKSEASPSSKCESSLRMNSSNMKNIFFSLLSNKIFMLLIMAQWFEGFVSNGLGTFFTKFMEVQYHLSPSQSGMYSGLLVIVGAASGTLLSGWLIKKYTVSEKKLIMYCAWITIVSGISLTAFLAGCSEQHLLNIPESEISTSTATSPTCFSKCFCSPSKFSPVCVDGNEAYFSACYAGCTSKVFDKVITYHNCTCKSSTSTGTSGGCTKKCSELYIIMTAGTFAIFMMFLSFVPSLNAQLRVVRKHESSVAMGIMQIVLRISFIISPIVYGLLIDQSCKKQLKNDNASSGVCILYDNQKMRIYLSLVSVVSKFIASLCYFTASYFCPPHRKIVGDGFSPELASTSCTEFNLVEDVPNSSTLDI